MIDRRNQNGTNKNNTTKNGTGRPNGKPGGKLNQGLLEYFSSVCVKKKMDFDYIIVGAGSSGSVMAARLSEDGKNKVLLLEAGGSDRRPKILVPGYSMLKIYGDPQYDWGFTSEPDPTRHDRKTR